MKLIYLLVTLLLLPQVSEARTIFSLIEKQTEFSENTGEYEVAIRVEENTVNAIEGEILLTDVSAVSVHKSNEVIPFWQEINVVPHNNNVSIQFAGFIPGGYSSNSTIISRTKSEFNTLFTFKATLSPTSKISFVENKLVALLHSQNGVQDKIFTDQTKEIEVHNNLTVKDKNGPRFTSTGIINKTKVRSDADLFYFSVFDKVSGVDRVEINQDGNWHTINSPFEITDSEIVLRAFDGAGNVTYYYHDEKQKFTTIWIYVALLAAFFMILLLWFAKKNNKITYNM